MNNLSIKLSLIHGKGVFADKDFKRGETVIDWKPCTMKLTQKEMDNLHPFERKFVSNNTLLQSPNRFLNHSCNNNIKVVNGKDVAVRDIAKGEEITTNYADKLDIPFIMRCKCRERGCRKEIY